MCGALHTTEVDHGVVHILLWVQLSGSKVWHILERCGFGVALVLRGLACHIDPAIVVVYLAFALSVQEETNVRSLGFCDFCGIGGLALVLAGVTEFSFGGVTP